MVHGVRRMNPISRPLRSVHGADTEVTVGDALVRTSLIETAGEYNEGEYLAFDYNGHEPVEE